MEPDELFGLWQTRQQLLAARLRTLRSMELADEVDRSRWRVDPSFLSVLQALQTSQDRQRMLAVAGSAPWHDAKSPVQRGSAKRVQADRGFPGRGGR